MSELLSEPLPAGWSRPPVYARFSVQLGKMLDEKRIAGTHLAPYLRNVDVQWEGVNTADLPCMDFSDEDRARYSLSPGDILVCEGGEVGRTTIWNGELDECFFQKAVHRLRPISCNDEPRYFRYFMRMAVDAGLFTQRTASTIAHLTAEQLRVVRYPSPPRYLQRAIADYLDRETARLDALVAAKERLLELLAEKRRALITHAVTRGLDPHAPLRDSGIPWLGEIPAHWEVVALRFLAGFSSGATPATGEVAYWGGEIPWVSPKDMKRTEVRDAEDHVTEGALAETSLKLIEPGAVLVVVRGMILAHSFPVAVNAESVTINQDMKALRCHDEVNPLFLRDFLRGSSEHLVSLADSSAHGTRKIDSEVLGRLEIPVPPCDEQAQIVGHIEARSAELSELSLATEASLHLLRERRAALIAGAVTGQIDVGEAV